MKIYTIGFTQKTGKEFFGLLSRHGIQRLVDIRINPQGQLSGFAKQDDLPYFLEELADHCKYIHYPLLAPTKDLLNAYHEDKNWAKYCLHFERLLDDRKIPEILNPLDFQTTVSCLLCSEATPEKCHRRLVAERLAHFWPNTEIVHL